MDPCPCSNTASPQPAICNALLGYISASIQGATLQSIRRAVLGCFTPAEIHEAKSALVKAIPGDAKQILTEQLKSRRGSSIKCKEDAEVDDILEIFGALDNHKSKPVIHVPAAELFRLPKSAPEDMAAVQVMERIAKLEAQVTDLGNSFALSTIDNCSLKTRVAEVEKTVQKREHAQDAHCAAPPLRTLHVPDLQRRPADESAAMASVPKPQPMMLPPLRPDYYASMMKKKPGPPQWEKQKPQRSETRAMVRKATSKLRVVTGKKESTEGVRGSRPVKHLYVYHVNPGVKTDGMKTMIEQGGVEVRSIRQVSKEDWLHGSFKVTINQADIDRAMDENFWPEEICCREWLARIPWKSNDSAEEREPDNNDDGEH
jgi:hypothetical protein